MAYEVCWNFKSFSQRAPKVAKLKDLLKSSKCQNPEVEPKGHLKRAKFVKPIMVRVKWVESGL